jgi:hypothetical protein
MMMMIMMMIIMTIMIMMMMMMMMMIMMTMMMKKRSLGSLFIEIIFRYYESRTIRHPSFSLYVRKKKIEKKNKKKINEMKKETKLYVLLSVLYYFFLSPAIVSIRQSVIVV